MLTPIEPLEHKGSGAVDKPESTSAGWGGWGTAVARILGPLLPSKEHWMQLLHALLETRQDTQPGELRAQALALLWELAFAAARFGSLNEQELAGGFSPFMLPPVPSERLVALGVVADPEAVWQIRMRRIGREERGKSPPDNRVVVKAADTHELNTWKLGCITLQRPILLLEEYYTVTIPRIRSAELDRRRVYGLCREDGELHIYFLGENQVPHAHFALREKGLAETTKWYRIDATTHPDFVVPLDIPLPDIWAVEVPAPTPNDQIAALLALFVEATRQALNGQ
jgi:hypothetical protein